MLAKASTSRRDYSLQCIMSYPLLMFILMCPSRMDDSFAWHADALFYGGVVGGWWRVTRELKRVNEGGDGWKWPASSYPAKI